MKFQKGDKSFVYKIPKKGDINQNFVYFQNYWGILIVKIRKRQVKIHVLY